MSAPDAIPTHPGAVVVGGGIAGLVSAWELARAGVRPLLVEARGYLGGLIARGAVGGANVDLGAETYVVRGTDTSSIKTTEDLPIPASCTASAAKRFDPRPKDCTGIGPSKRASTPCPKRMDLTSRPGWRSLTGTP